jgi:U4/U6 small nuclear ribonucleoprotein PRP4
MRSLKALYTIPAHLSNVSDVRFFRPTEGLSSPSIYHNPAAMTGVQTSGDPPDRLSDIEDQEQRYRSGLYLASAGYDGLVKLWSADDWQLLKTLSTDAGKVMSVDLSGDGRLCASGTYNRNFQLFEAEA